MENSPKKYLYHRVPEVLEGDTLHPLHKLKSLGETDSKFRELYEKVSKKYIPGYRESIPEIKIPTLENAKWGDVLYMSPIHPEDLKKELNDAGFATQEMKFYQIDPEMLDSKLLTVFLYNDDLTDDDPKNYTSYDSEKLREHSVVSQKTVSEYKRLKKVYGDKEFKMVFVRVPHYLLKDSLDVSNLPVITVSAGEGKEPDSHATK